MDHLLETFRQFIGFEFPEPPLREIIFALALSFALNLLVAWVYKRTYRGVLFSQDYAHSLLILGTTVSVVVMVVHMDGKHSQSTAFGVFAAFSIIRFRALVEQTRDIGFLFVAMAAGLGVGARAYLLATTTTILICAIIYGFSALDLFAAPRASHRLRIRVTNDINYDEVFEPCFTRFVHDRELVSVESIQAGMMTELRYNIHLKNESKVGEFVTELQLLNANNRVLLTSTVPNRTLGD